PLRADTALGLPLFVEDAGVALDTAVRVFNRGASAATVSVQAFDPGGAELPVGLGDRSIRARGSLVPGGSGPATAPWFGRKGDRAVVARARVSSAAGGIATIPAVSEQD